MLDIQQLRNDLDTVVAKLASRKFAFDVAGFTALEAERKEVQTRTQDLQAKRNATSKQIGMAKAKGEDVSAIMAEVAGLGDQLKADEERLAAIHFQSVANQTRFILARDARDSAQMRRWIAAESDLAVRLHALQILDSRIGFEASNQYFYVPLDLAEKVINCQWLADSLGR